MWKALLSIHVCLIFLFQTWITYMYIVFHDLSKHSIPILSEELWMSFRGTLLWNQASFLQGNWKQSFQMIFFCFCVQRLYIEVWLKIVHRSNQRFFGGMLLPARFSSLRALFMDIISCLFINPYQDLATEEL